MIELKRYFDEKGKYLGKQVIYEVQLTPELLAKIKIDKDWKKYHKMLKDKGFDIGEVEI